MTISEQYKLLCEEKTQANRMAREIVKRAKEEKVSVPTLVASIVNEYACDCEAAVERELAKEW